MSNIPGDLSADPTADTLQVEAVVTGAIVDGSSGDCDNPAVMPQPSASRSTAHVTGLIAGKTYSVSSGSGTAIAPNKLEEDSDNDEEEEEDQAYVGGIKLRDLSGSEVQQFPGLKREKWWSADLPRNHVPWYLTKSPGNFGDQAMLRLRQKLRSTRLKLFLWPMCPSSVNSPSM